jgi:hypothetical protein
MHGDIKSTPASRIHVLAATKALQRRSYTTSLHAPMLNTLGLMLSRTILYKSQQLPLDNQGTWPAFTFQQCIFGSPILCKLQSARRIWSLLRGVTLWHC